MCAYLADMYIRGFSTAYQADMWLGPPDMLDLDSLRRSHLTLRLTCLQGELLCPVRARATPSHAARATQHAVGLPAHVDRARPLLPP